MLLDQVSAGQMRAGQILAGAAMAGFIGARMFRGHARNIRLAITTLYIVGVIGFTIYALK
ncbi:hypothetical protein [Rhodopila sp.]|uniref:hypothetical protein n=1 Tax=Rhodopila sp. TaxID=2480087 RepID=UPI003D0F6F44